MCAVCCVYVRFDSASRQNQTLARKIFSESGSVEINQAPVQLTLRRIASKLSESVLFSHLNGIITHTRSFELKLVLCDIIVCVVDPFAFFC